MLKNMDSQSNKIELAIFDLDGTLLDTIELIYLSFKYATEKILHKEISRDKLIKNIGRPLLEQMKYFSTSQAPRLVEVYNKHNTVIHDDLVKAYPGAAETLSILRGRGLRVGIVTSKMREVAKRGLALCGLESYIEKLVAMEDTALHKPDPEPVKFILKEFGIKADNSVFVGDSPFDMAAARGAGSHSIAALWGPFSYDVLKKEKPDKMLKNITELPDYINKLSS